MIPDREVISGHVLQAAEKAFREKVLEEVNTMIDVKKIVEEIAARCKIETGESIDEIVLKLRANDIRGWTALSKIKGEELGEEVFEEKR